MHNERTPSSTLKRSASLKTRGNCLTTMMGARNTTSPAPTLFNLRPRCQTVSNLQTFQTDFEPDHAVSPVTSSIEFKHTPTNLLARSNSMVISRPTSPVTNMEKHPTTSLVSTLLDIAGLTDHNNLRRKRCKTEPDLQVLQTELHPDQATPPMSSSSGIIDKRLPKPSAWMMPRNPNSTTMLEKNTISPVSTFCDVDEVLDHKNLRRTRSKTLPALELCSQSMHKSPRLSPRKQPPSLKAGGHIPILDLAQANLGVQDLLSTLLDMGTDTDMHTDIDTDIKIDIEEKHVVGPSVVSSGVCLLQGTKRSMEDAVQRLTLEPLNTSWATSSSPLLYYAVMDGHNGFDAVTYVTKHLTQFLVLNLETMSLPNALATAYQSVDESLINFSELKDWESGTTLVSVIIQDKTLTIHHVGDSRAVLSRQGNQRVIELTMDHSPSSRTEQATIHALGGHVTKDMENGDYRLDGMLSVSRAFGDFDPWSKKKLLGLSCTPEITTRRLDPKDEFMILATDGFYEKFTSQQAVMEARRLLRQAASGLSTDALATQVAASLAAMALKLGSTDNVAVMVILLEAGLTLYHEASTRSPVLAQASSSSSLHGSKVPSIRTRPIFNFKSLRSVMHPDN